MKGTKKDIFLCDEIEYKIEDGQAVVVGLTKHAGGTIDIISIIHTEDGNEYPATRIKKEAFYGNSSLRFVRIPEGVKK